MSPEACQPKGVLALAYALPILRLLPTKNVSAGDADFVGRSLRCFTKINATKMKMIEYNLWLRYSNSEEFKQLGESMAAGCPELERIERDTLSSSMVSSDQLRTPFTC